jgi:hypothetical protein
MGDHTDISGATSAVDFSSVQKIKPPRVACALSLGLLYVALGILAYAGAKVSTSSGDFKLPADLPTQLLLHFSQFLQSPMGLLAAGLSFLCMLLLLVRGSLDKILKILIIVNVIVVVGLLAWSFAGLVWPVLDAGRGPLPK